MQTQVIELSWKDIEYYTDCIIEQLKEENYKPDIIVTIKRGGLVPAVILSHKLGIKDILIIDASRTEDDRINAQKHRPTLIFDEQEIDRVKEKKLLLVDDIVGSGETLRAVRKLLMAHNPKFIVSTTLITNLNNLKKENLKPDIVGNEVRGWIIFPWENKPPT